MKKHILFYFLFFTISVFSQNYEKQWNEVYETESKRNIKDAYDDVLQIEQKAQKKNNQEELIKVFLFKLKYENILLDKKHSDFFTEINNQIKKANGKSVYFYNYIKSVYLATYFNKYQSDIQRRGDAEIIKSDADFKEWNQRDFVNALTDLYNRTFSNPEKLEVIPLSDFKNVIEDYESSKQENVYEFLLEKWMLLPLGQLYANTEPSNLAYYTNYKESFLTENFSHNYDVRLRAFQMLEAYYKQNKKFYQYDRVKFMRFHHNFLLDDLNVLDALIANSFTNEIKNKYRFEKLSYYFEHANKKENPTYFKQAIALIDSLKTQVHSKEFLDQISAQEKYIKNKRLLVFNEPILYNQQHNKILVDFKNIDTLYNFIYKIDDLQKFNHLKSDSLYFNYIKSQQPFQVLEVAMPNHGDYNNYTTEVLLPDFSQGYYVLVSSYEKNVTENTPSVRFNPFGVSDVFIVYKEFNENLELQLLNRKSGKPLINTKVLVLDKFYTSDENGFVKIKINKDTFDKKANYDVLVYTDNFIYQETFKGNQFYSYGNNSDDDEKDIMSFVYTDRGLYRPGQEVYFKAILVEIKDGINRKASKDLRINVELRDSRYNVVSNLILTTNDFGSVSGKFVIPKNVDDGSFEISISEPDELTKSEEKLWETIDLEHNYVSFEVAEYKRNTFEVKLNPYQENIQIGETINLSGSVKSFAQASIANAKVTISPLHQLTDNYFKSKTVNYPKIETFTDANGNFNFPFTFVKDSLSQNDLKNRIEYYFTAEVLDNSAEVREAVLQINYDKKSFAIKYIPESHSFYKNGDKLEVEILTNTINGKFVPIKGQVKVFKRSESRKFQLEALWMKPTTQIIDSVTLADKFPYQSYVNDLEKDIPKLVFAQEYETKENEKFVLNDKLFDLGEYYLQFIPNDNLFPPAKHKFNFSVLDYTFHGSVSIEIDEDKSLRSKKIQLKIFSKVPEVYVNLDLNYLGNQNKSFIIHLKQGENFVELPIDIENRDIRFKSNLYFVYENRLFNEFVEISFPYKKDYSTIKTEIVHLNDKLNPGEDYNWKLKVFNQNKPKEQIEVLATIYDFSLDAIHSERWDNFYFYNYEKTNLPEIKNSLYNYFEPDFYNYAKPVNYYYNRSLTSKTDFNWFGFDFFDKSITKKFISTTKLNTVAGEISGRIFSRDYGDNVPGATLLVVGTTNGVDTDENGYFRLKAKQGDVISVNYLGFKTLKFIVDGSYFEIPLEEDENNLLFEEIVVDTYRTMPNNTDTEVNEKNKTMANVLNGHANIKLRKNLSETAFFYPNLYPNNKGEVEIKFKAPEALTKWKLKTLANDKHGNSNYFAHLAYTQRNVMIQPNMPRFVRETDIIELKARVSNTTNSSLKATALLRLFNTITGEDLTNQIIKTEALIPVAIQANSSNSVSWQVQIPKNIEGLQYRISVQADNFTDAEESVIPVLSYRELVTETVPIWQLGNETKKYELTNLLTNESTSLENHQLRIDVSNNSTWLMMQSLPYLYEYPYDCSEQLFAKYFAYAIAANILENNEPIQKLVAAWRENPKSKLDENEELNQILSQDLPWLKDLISDNEKKAQFVSFFDEQSLLQKVSKIEDILIERQTASGGLPWFNGGRASNYITNHILVTATKLKKLGIQPNFIATDKETKFINKANTYLDVTFNDLFTKDKEATFFEIIDYALVKSYYADVFAIPEKNKERIEKRLAELRNDWITLPLYEKAKLILIANRKGDKQWANEIANQLEQTAVLDETYGMYWRENVSRYYFYYNEAEVQALIVEAFKEVKKPQETINKLNAWLISRKSQTSWGTTKATTESLYAILLGEDQKTISNETIKIKVGNEKINTAKNKNLTLEEAVGMFSYRWLANQIKPAMGKIEVENKTSKPIFGGIYWQYFEDLNQIKKSEDGILNINRTYYSQNRSGKWEFITSETKLELGQKVKVRLDIEAKRDFSFIHVKDNRPATFEPLDILSQYHYKTGMIYYQTNKDASTNFFFDFLSKGNHKLEYEVRLNNIGSFSSGNSTIQSMYAPAHSAHTSGAKIEVK